MTQEEGLTGDEYKKMTEETCANCGQLKEQHPYFHEYRDECKKFKAKLVMDDESRVIEEKPQNHSPQSKVVQDGNQKASKVLLTEGTQNHAEKSLSEKKKKWRHVFVEGRQHTIYCVYGEKDVKEAVKRLKDKGMIMKIPKGAIGGRGGEFIKIVEVKEINKIMGDNLI